MEAVFDISIKPWEAAPACAVMSGLNCWALLMDCLSFAGRRGWWWWHIQCALHIEEVDIFSQVGGAFPHRYLMLILSFQQVSAVSGVEKWENTWPEIWMEMEEWLVEFVSGSVWVDLVLAQFVPWPLQMGFAPPPLHPVLLHPWVNYYRSCSPAGHSQGTRDTCLPQACAWGLSLGSLQEAVLNAFELLLKVMELIISSNDNN